MRLISGFGIAGVYSIGNLLASEFVPTRIRTTVLGILMSGWSTGYVVAALLSSYILPHYGWRPLFLCAVAPGIVALIMLYGVPDPASWSASRSGGARPSSTFGEIWRNVPVRRTVILWSLTSIALQFGYYGANTWLPSLSRLGPWRQSSEHGLVRRRHLHMSIVGKIITGYLADIFGRRAMWVATGLLTAVYLPILIYFATPTNVPYLPAWLRVALRCTVRGAGYLRERKLPIECSRNGGGGVLQHRSHRLDDLTDPDRARGRGLHDWRRHRAARRRLRDLRVHPRDVHPREDVRSKGSGRVEGGRERGVETGLYRLS
jgi:hypothetical protein